MERIKRLLNHIKGFASKTDCLNGLVFASGFFIGSRCTEVLGTAFAAVAWVFGSFIVKKILNKINK
jgi:hypothetical protein